MQIWILDPLVSVCKRVFTLQISCVLLADSIGINVNSQISFVHRDKFSELSDTWKG